MSKKSSSASSDPFAGFSAMMQAQAAQQQTALGQDWLSFSKEQFATANERQKGIDELTGKVTQAHLDSMSQANQWATEDRARYKSVFQPLQDRFIEKANNWDSIEAQAKAAAEAKADVSNAFAAQDAGRQRAMAAKGINPASGAYAGVERAADSEAALGAAGAQNVARNQLRKEAIGLQGDALNIGAGLPSQSLSALGAGVGAGTSAAGVGLGAEGNFRANTGIMNSGFEGAGGLYKSAGNAWGNIYGNRVDLLNQQDKSDSQGFGAVAGGLGAVGGMYGKDIMGGLGTLGTAGLAFLSDESTKEDRRPTKGVLDALRSMPIDQWKYKPGEGDEGKHVGPMAQDFSREFGVGDGRSISVVDGIGVAMKAIQELAEKVDGIKGGARPRSKSIMRAA